MVRTKVAHLTDTQSRILAAIRRAIVDDGVAPTGIRLT